MSWQAYVDTNLLGTGKVSRAAILGKQGGVWATSSEYSIAADEQKAIVNAFNNIEQTLASGVRAAGTKFFTLQADEERIYGKKGPDGIVIVRTKQAILVGEYKAPLQAAECTPVVEGLADYLKSVGY